MNVVDHLVEQLGGIKVGELPISQALACPCCDQPLYPEGFEPTYDEYDKLFSWTLAQLISFRRLQRRSGIDFRWLLERTSGGVMPGIGGALVGDVGTIGISDFHGTFVGIEPDGYSHS